jgi:hypothetical protein
MRDEIIGPRLPDPRMIPHWQVVPEQRRSDDEEDDGRPAQDADLADAALVRPFMVTGGRTQPLEDGLRIETIVSARPAALSAPLRFELRRTVELCQTPITVADIAVRLGVPLGVARVLVGDLVAEGYATIAAPIVIPIDVIERIRDRVRAL